jgi:hypothetical protein
LGNGRLRLALLLRYDGPSLGLRYFSPSFSIHCLIRRRSLVSPGRGEVEEKDLVTNRVPCCSEQQHGELSALSRPATTARPGNRGGIGRAQSDY